LNKKVLILTVINLDKNISDLLHKHNCVVVPSFGGFVAKQVPSRFLPEEGKLFPPSKQILFNPNLRDDDGLLKHSISSYYSISYEETTIKIDEIVTKWKRDLENGDAIEFCNIGSLKKENSEKYTFNQNLYSNLLIDSYGLKEFSFKPIQASIKIGSPNNATEKSGRIIKFISNSVKYAAILLIAIVAFYGYWLPSHTQVIKSGIIHWSDLNPFLQVDGPRYHPKVFEFEKNSLEDENSAFIENELKEELVIDQQKPVEIELVQEEINPEIIDTNNKKELIDYSYEKLVAGNIKVVVGCFEEEQNIIRFMDKLQQDGFTPFREKHGALTRVCICSSNDMDTAKSAVNRSREFGYKGWILK
jgi:nucleoid DNA-binding protein